jgi:hypothetical protein
MTAATPGYGKLPSETTTDRVEGHIGAKRTGDMPKACCGGSHAKKANGDALAVDNSLGP